MCDSILDQYLDDQELKTGYAQSILEHLKRSNLFIIPLDQKRQWYRYHHLFSDFLKAQLIDKVETKEIANLHSKASRWFSKNKMMFQAVEHAIESGDYLQAASLINDDVNEIFSRSELQTLTRWLADFPPEIFTSQPLFSIIAAWAFLATGQSAEVESHLSNVEDVLGIKADGSPESMALSPEIRGALAEICCIRTSLSFN